MCMLMCFVNLIRYLIANSGLDEEIIAAFGDVSRMLYEKNFPKTQLIIVVKELLQPLMNNTEAHKAIMSLFGMDSCKQKGIKDLGGDTCQTCTYYDSFRLYRTGGSLAYSSLGR